MGTYTWHKTNTFRCALSTIGVAGVRQLHGSGDMPGFGVSMRKCHSWCLKALNAQFTKRLVEGGVDKIVHMGWMNIKWEVNSYPYS